MTGFRLLVATGLVIASLSGCKKTAGGNTPVTEAQATRIAEAAEATFTSGDPTRILDQYAEDAVLIDASKPDPTSDRKVATDSVRALVSMKPADYRVVGRHIQLLGPDAFVSSGIEQFTVAAGAARPTVSARFNDVFQRQSDGKWKIVNEHVSMPPTPAGQL